jgi:3-oxoacyl-(acyl-carrier-protein) synthase
VTAARANAIDYATHATGTDVGDVEGTRREIFERASRSRPSRATGHTSARARDRAIARIRMMRRTAANRNLVRLDPRAELDYVRTRSVRRPPREQQLRVRGSDTSLIFRRLRRGRHEPRAALA